MLMWDQFEETVAKLAKLDPETLTKETTNIAHYYFRAAQYVLAEDKDSKAIYYLEQALTYQIDLIEAVSLH